VGRQQLSQTALRMSVQVANKDAGSGRKPTATLTLKLFISKVYPTKKAHATPRGERSDAS
jgi:hypothetical protein